jgi:hypothetical protein
MSSSTLEMQNPTQLAKEEQDNLHDLKHARPVKKDVLKLQVWYL